MKFFLCMLTVAAGFAFSGAAAAADPPLCQGEQATITSADAVGGVITGTDGADVIVGSDAPDTINAGGGDDLVCAGGGADQVTGGDGNDQLYMEDGGTLFVDGVQAYQLACGSSALADDVTDYGQGGGGADLLDGGQGADCLKGQGGNDAIIGGIGADDLRGNAGADFVSGDDADDNLRDGFGADDMSGGADDDTWQRCADGQPENQDGTIETVTVSDNYC